jgi:hypothetical protein
MNARLGHIVIACGVVAIALVACGGTVGAVGDGAGSSPAADPAATAAPPDGGAISNGGDDAATADAAGADGAPQADGGAPDAAPKDEPCPQKLDVNCSASCGGPTKCSQVACNLPLTAGYVVSDDDFPFVMRTPSSPGSLTPGGLPPQCANICGGALFYGLHFRVITTTQPQLRVRVEAPWVISNAAATADNAACQYRVHCMSLTVGSSPIVPLVVATTDPNAPARNVVIEATSDPCVP